MGYTNYWTQSKKQDRFSDEFVEMAREICRLGFDRGIELASGDGETSFGVFELNEELLKDYVANDGIWINGFGDESCETFSLEPQAEVGEFSFCKTARNRYDAVVKALMFLAYKEGIIRDISWDSCGDKKQNEGGFALYESATKDMSMREEMSRILGI
ncbi:hypothetical protein [Helicobacter labetoulli]|uniref:hypothetical protein n=1 Tax=Helicobacter labetoulli TaxID=2315333 RepID=UPI001FCA134C|nr:hypothetical protein [Helicobacter labetoulli]